jgi:hypothetical protein
MIGCGIAVAEVAARHRQGGGVLPPAAATRFGALTAAGAGGFPVAGTSITSGDPSGHWQVTGGYLSPSTAGDTANLASGPYVLGLSDGSTVTVTIDANAWDVRTQAEWDTVIAQTAASLSGKTVFVRPDSYRGGASLVTGVDGVAARLRRNDYGGLVIKGRVPAFTGTVTEPTEASDRTTVNRFVLRGARGVVFEDLATTKAAEKKFDLIGESANNVNNITIRRCHVSGAVADPYGDFSTSSNYPNNNIDIIASGSGVDGSVGGNITIEDNWVQWGATPVSVRRLGPTAVVNIKGNRVQFFYDDGIAVEYGGQDNPVEISDNVVGQSVGRPTDSAGPHVDAIRLIGKITATTDWTVKVNRNILISGGSRGDDMQGALLSDFKSGGTDSGRFFIAEMIGNVTVGDSSVSLQIENAKNCVVLNNTGVAFGGSNPSTCNLFVGTGSSSSTSSGTHRVERNIAEAFGIGGSPSLADNITLGLGGATIAYSSAFDGPTFSPANRAEVLAAFARKAGGPADLGGAVDAGAIGSGAVTWAAIVPGSGGTSHVS